MTRRGTPEERRWRRNRNLEPGADGTVHGEQSVDPRGRVPREKPSGHRHQDPQPHEDHGPEHDAGGADENPHTTTTTNPHSVTHSQVGAPTGNPHGVTAEEANAVRNAIGSPSKRRDTRANQPAPANVAVGSEYRVKDEGEILEVATDTDSDGTADTWTPVSASDHGNERHTPNMVENQVGSPSRRRENRADQPLPGDVPVGTISTIKDEGELQEVATDTDGDGVADTWKQSSTRGVVPTQYVTAADSRQQNIDNSDFQATATNDHTTIQNALDSLPVGTK